MKQTYTYEVNGFQIHAEYEEKDIETIFIPLLQKWLRGPQIVTK